MIIILTLIIGLSVGGFYFAQNWLRTMVINYNYQNNTSQSATTPNTTQASKQLETDVSSHQVIADKAAGLIASSNYQSDIKSDLDKYAKNTNIRISDISLTEAPGDKKTQAISDVNSRYLKVTLINPMSYTDLLKFIKAIETNIPKMNLQGINIKSESELTGSVTADPLIIKAFIR
jgi:hypothetical protein